MTDAAERRARKLFKLEHPGRNWDLIATRRLVGFDIDNPHASEAEREHFRVLARAELLTEQAAAAAGEASRS